MSLDMIKRAGVVLEKVDQRAKEAGLPPVFELAELYLGIDHSGSMSGYFNDRRRPVTHLAKQVCALGLARLDPDGKVPVMMWSGRPEQPEDATFDNLDPQPARFGRTRPGIIESLSDRARWGSTDLAAAIRALTDLHCRTDLSKPGLAVIQTDGEPNDQEAAIAALVDASKYNLFFVFIGYGSGFQFLARLNRGGFPGQVVDNAYAFEAGADPTAMSDDEVFEQLVAEVPKWRRDAAGKVRGTV